MPKPIEEQCRICATMPTTDRRAMENMLRNGQSLNQVLGWLQKHGYDYSRSSLYRHSKHMDEVMPIPMSGKIVWKVKAKRPDYSRVLGQI